MLYRNALYVVMIVTISSGLSHAADPGATSFYTAQKMREAAQIQAAERERKAGEERCRQNQARLNAEAAAERARAEAQAQARLNAARKK